jgi:GntR family transcriptional regulator, rspAB operon transcriptional repressor
VERAALRVTESEVTQLRSVHAGYTGDDDESYDRYTDENRRFHYLVARSSGNQELAEMIGHLHDRLARFMVLRHAGKSQEITHARIVDALEAHNIEQARQALLDDIESSRDAILDGIIDEVAASWHLDKL